MSKKHGLKGLTEEEMWDLGAKIREGLEEQRHHTPTLAELEDEATSDQAFRAADQLREATAGLVERIRAKQHAAPSDVRVLHARLDAFRSMMAHIPARVVPPDTFRPEVERARVLLRHAPTITAGRAARVREQAMTLTPAQDLDGALILLILANPGSASYWGLARAVRDHIHSLDQRASRKNRELAWLLYTIIPRGAFHGENTIASPPRGAGRTTHVDTVTPAGLPGLGKRH